MYECVCELHNSIKLTKPNNHLAIHLQPVMFPIVFLTSNSSLMTCSPISVFATESLYSIGFSWPPLLNNLGLIQVNDDLPEKPANLHWILEAYQRVELAGYKQLN